MLCLLWFLILKEPCEPRMKPMTPHEFAIDGVACQMRQDIKKSDPYGSLLCLVVFWHQNRSHASVSLGDDPELDAASGVINRKETKALFKGQFILLPVMLVHVSPITGLMPLDGKQDVVLRQLVERVRRGYHLAKPKLGDRHGCSAHGMPPATIS